MTSKLLLWRKAEVLEDEGGRERAGRQDGSVASFRS